MSKEFEEKEPAFKVVDKRCFTKDGQIRNDHQTSDRIESERDLKTENKVDKKEEKDQGNRPTMTFSLFVQSLCHQAMIGLGMVPWPDSGLLKNDFNLARESIDVLSILQEKTKGNLDPEEQNLMDGMLYQLRVAFVQKSGQPSEDTPSSIIR